MFNTHFLLCSAPAARVTALCPDCPTFIGFDNEEVKETVTLSLEKFNKESSYPNRFALRHISRATAGVSLRHVFEKHTNHQVFISLFLSLFIGILTPGQDAEH